MVMRMEAGKKWKKLQKETIESLSSVGDTASWCKVKKRNGINEMTFDEGGNKRRRLKKKSNRRQVEGSV